MAVLVGSDWIFAVIQMDSLQSVQTDYAVKFLQDAVQVVYDIITGIPYMAGVQTDSYLFG